MSDRRHSKVEQIKAVWIGHLTKEPLRPPVSSSLLQQHTVDFQKELWGQIVGVARTYVSATQQRAPQSKSAGPRGVAGAKLGRSKVFEGVLEQGRAVSPCRPAEVVRAVHALCDMRVECETYDGGVYLHACVRFHDDFVQDQFVAHAKWPAGVTVTLVTRARDMRELATPPSRTRASASGERPVIHEILRRRDEVPVGWWRAVEALLHKLVVVHSTLDARQQLCSEPFHVTKEPSFALSKYLERIYLYSGQNALSRITVALLYIERLLTGGYEEGALRLQNSLHLTGLLARSASRRLLPCGLKGDLSPPPQDVSLDDDSTLRQILLALNQGYRRGEVNAGAVPHWMYADWAELEGEWDTLDADPPSRARKFYRHVAAKLHGGEPLGGRGNPADDAVWPRARRDSDSDSDGGALDALERYSLVPPQHRIPVAELTVHKLLLTSVLLATKQHDDTLRSNASYAAIGGFPICQLDRMEVALLELLQYDLWVEPAFYRQFGGELRRFCDMYVENEVRTVVRREWEFLLSSGGRRVSEDNARYVEVAVHRLLNPADFVELAGVLQRYREQCREEVRELERQGMHRNHKSQLLAEQDRERRRVIDKRMGNGHVPPDAGLDDEWRVSQDEGLRICDFTSVLPAAIDGAWAEVLKFCESTGVAQGQRSGRGDTAKAVAKACTKRWIQPAQLPGMPRAVLEQAVGGAELVGAAGAVAAAVRQLLDQQDVHSLEKSVKEQPAADSSTGSSAAAAPTLVTPTPRKQKRVQSIQVQAGSCSLSQLTPSDACSIQALCRQYIVENGGDLPEDTLRSPLRASFRAGVMSPRMVGSRSSNSRRSASMLTASPVDCGASPTPCQVSHAHGIASDCRLSPTGGAGGSSGDRGSASPYQKTAREAQQSLWTKISTGKSLCADGVCFDVLG